jgi:hypothetical protein
MNTNGLPHDPPGRQFFSQNRATHPLDITAPYFNKYIAWKADGTKILASGESLEALEANLITMGIDPGQIVSEFVPDPDIGYVVWHP